MSEQKPQRLHDEPSVSDEFRTITGAHRAYKVLAKRQKFSTRATGVGVGLIALLGALHEAGVFAFLRDRLEPRETRQTDEQIQRLAKEIAKELRNHE